MRAGAGDHDIGERAGAQRLSRREVDKLVLPGSAGEHARVLPRRPLDDDLFRATDPGSVPGHRGPLDDDPQSLEPLRHNVRGDELVASLSGLGTGAGRVDEGVGAVVVRGGRDLERGGEVGVGLARKARR